MAKAFVTPKIKRGPQFFDYQTEVSHVLTNYKKNRLELNRGYIRSMNKYASMNRYEQKDIDFRLFFTNRH